MDTYAARIHAKTLPHNPDFSKVGEAWLVIFTRDESQDAANLRIDEYLHATGWSVIQIAEFGRYNLALAPNRETVEPELSRCGICILVGGVPPTDDRNFSKS